MRVSWAEWGLVWLLQLQGVMLLLALPAVFLPFSWMAIVRSLLGLGELPQTPMVE